ALVVDNVAKGRCSSDIAALYDSVETQLQALESLGRTQEKFADFLTPLIESCMPEELLKTWQRRCAERVRDTQQTDSASDLKELMTFMGQEVNSQRLYNLARSGFGSAKRGAKVNSDAGFSDKSDYIKHSSMPTASCLTNMRIESTGPASCVFCEKTNHLSTD